MSDTQGDDNDLDFSKHFSENTTLPEPNHTAAQLKEIDDLGSIGAGVLKDQGFYVRIVTARPAGGTLPANPEVMVVEDDPGTSAVLVKALQAYGYRTRTAKDRGGIAAALSKPPVPDLILLDVMLEDINGFDVLNRLRQHSATRWVPVIMLTSLSEPADIGRGLGLGANAYLSKPLLPSTLIDAVQAVLGG